MDDSQEQWEQGKEHENEHKERQAQEDSQTSGE